MINLTESQFDELYPDLKGSYDFFNNPPPPGTTKSQFEQTYLRSKLWRLNNIYTIVNKDGVPVTFRMNYGQHKVYAASRIHPRIIILKSRQQGISTLWLVSYFDDALFRPLMNIGLMAQGDDEAKVLLERTKFLWDSLSADIKAFLNINTTKDNTREFTLTNRSTIFIRVSFRSTTLQRLHISEFGKIANAKPKRAKETKTGTLQALGRGNTGVIESTAEGQNMFKYMWDDAEVALASGTLAAKDFYPVFLSWLDDPDCAEPVYQADTDVSIAYFKQLSEETGRVLTQEQKNFWIAQYRELGAEVSQEYPATPAEAFQGSRDGTFYNQLYLRHVLAKGRVMTDLYDENLPVIVFFDLGVDDYFVVGFAQYFDRELRIVDEYYNSGYDLEHYVTEVESRGYDIAAYVFPHDINVRDLSVRSGNGGGRAVTRKQVVLDIFKEQGITRSLYVGPKSGIADGIETTKAMLHHTWIDPKCKYLISCIQNYTKAWDERLQKFKAEPVHDDYSHGADMLRGLSQMLPRLGWNLGKTPVVQQDDYDYDEPSSSGGFAV